MSICIYVYIHLDPKYSYVLYNEQEMGKEKINHRLSKGVLARSSRFRVGQASVFRCSNAKELDFPGGWRKQLLYFWIRIPSPPPRRVPKNEVPPCARNRFAPRVREMEPRVAVIAFAYEKPFGIRLERDNHRVIREQCTTK